MSAKGVNMLRETIIKKVIAKIAKNVRDNSNTFINKIKTDNGFLWEVGLNTDLMCELENEKEAQKKLEEFKDLEKKIKVTSGFDPLKKIKLI